MNRKRPLGKRASRSVRQRMLHFKKAMSKLQEYSASRCVRFEHLVDITGQWCFRVGDLLLLVDPPSDLSLPPQRGHVYIVGFHKGTPRSLQVSTLGHFTHARLDRAVDKAATKRLKFHADDIYEKVAMYYRERPSGT